VVAAEEAGADVVTIWDHFFPLFGDRDGRHFEAWTMLAAWAEATSRVELATLVSAAGYRNPDLLADMARTVDHVSGGRLILGLGAGWAERDFTEYGYGFPADRERLDQLQDALPRIRSRWDRLNPAPTRRIPILVGGGGERRTLRYAARYADLWHLNATPETLRQKSAVLDEWCARQGRDPAEIERSCAAGPPTSRHEPTVPVGPEGYGPALQAAGATLFNVRCGGPAFDLGPLREWLAWRDEVNGTDS
jgi:probable F420-dependent oxidoreductase